MKKLLSVVLALLMLAVMLPVVSLADDTLPAAPTMNGNEWTVTPDNAQATLDGAYGSIDGKTIILSAGTYGQLELGRATAYEGSNTKYYLGGIESNPDILMTVKLLLVRSSRLLPLIPKAVQGLPCMSAL